MFKKLINLTVFAIIFGLLPFNLQAKEAAKWRVAVFNFDAMVPTKDGWAVTLADTLSDALINSGKVAVVEREKINAVLKEQNLSSSDLADQSTKTKLGRLIGANRMVFGTYMAGEDGSVNANIRLTDVETSLILTSTNIEGNKDDIENQVAEYAGELIDNMDNNGE